MDEMNALISMRPGFWEQSWIKEPFPHSLMNTGCWESSPQEDVVLVSLAILD